MLRVYAMQCHNASEKQITKLDRTESPTDSGCTTHILMSTLVIFYKKKSFFFRTRDKMRQWEQRRTFNKESNRPSFECSTLLVARKFSMHIIDFWERKKKQQRKQRNRFHEIHIMFLLHDFFLSFQIEPFFRLGNRRHYDQIFDHTKYWIGYVFTVNVVRFLFLLSFIRIDRNEPWKP